MTATIPAVERDISRKAGERFAPASAGSIKRAVTIMCARERARDAWRKLDFQGDVTFTDAPSGRGTIVTVSIPDAAPQTALGSAAATLKQENPADAVADALRHLKAQVETGEIPTTDGQPSGRRS